MRTVLLAIALSANLGASAQSPAPPFKKVAIISLVGDQLSVDIFRARLSGALDNNAREVQPLQDAVFDHTALFAVADAGAKLLPSSSFLPLTVPKAGDLLDPNLLLRDKTQPIAGSVTDALKKQGFDHLIAVTKHSAATQIRFSHGNVSTTGQLRGLGFYVDHATWTRPNDTGAYAQGFIAPYAYLKLSLVDLSTGSVVKEQAITASSPQSAAQNKDATGAWDTLSAKEKADLLRELIRVGITKAVPPLLLERN